MTTSQPLTLGLVGLGRMGSGMRERLRQDGHTVFGYTRSGKNADVTSLDDLIAKLPKPRAVWLMVPAGEATEQNVVAMMDKLEPGDTLIDGGNSNFHDSVQRGLRVNERGIGYIDAGVSGGIWGLREGFAIMVGGPKDHVERLRPVFESLAPAGGFVHAGPQGAGHFTKMVHNGIEYGIMQAYGEGYELLKACDIPIDVPGAVECWRHGSVIRSWLLDLLKLALDEDPELAQIEGYVDDSGEGRWTIDEAVRLGVPATVLAHSLFARFTSRQEDSEAMKVIAALRNQFGGHAVKEA